MTTTTYTTVNGRILRQNKDGVVHNFVSDPLRSVVMVWDTSGNTVYEAEYDHYGNVQSETGTNPSEFGYVGTLGSVKDSASSLYVRARYLLTNLGRWLTKDPLWPSEPGFVYAGANPVMNGDKFGLQTREGWIPPAPGGNVMDCYPSNPYRCTPRPMPPGPESIKIGDRFPHGHYCGQSTDPFAAPCGDAPRFLPEPVDCLDRACKTHDACLSGHDVFGRSGAHCHCLLAAAAFHCSLLGCNGDLVYLLKSRLYVATFAYLCLRFPFEPGPLPPPTSGPGSSPKPLIMPNPVGPLPGKMVRPGPNPIFN